MSDQLPPQTFGFENSRDLCEKLKREYQRLEEARDREHIADHAINFAITAWHLNEWIWKLFERNDEYFSFTGTAKKDCKNWTKMPDFRDYICGREQRVRYCGLIASSAKHLELFEKVWPEQNEISTPVSGKNVNSPGNPITLRKIISGEVEWIPKIVVGDDRLDARAVFKAVLTIWTDFVYHETCER